MLKIGKCDTCNFTGPVMAINPLTKICLGCITEKRAEMQRELADYERNKKITVIGERIVREIDYSPDGSTGFLTVADAKRIIEALGEHFAETDEEGVVSVLVDCLIHLKEQYPFLQEERDGKQSN